MSWRCEDSSGRARAELVDALTTWPQQAELVRSSTVTVSRVLAPDGQDCVLKRYRFPRLLRRLEAAFRHTWLAQPKARREWRALVRMTALDLPVVAPLGCGWRRDALGFVTDSFLLTRWWPHPDLARRMAAGEALPPAAWQAIGSAIGALHARGVLHGGLAARNVLAGMEASGAWQARLVDPVRARFRRSSLSPHEADQDLLPLQPALTGAGLEARAAFAAGYCKPSLLNSAAKAGSTSCASPTMP
jgi:tRNA A-37 threonylcarbamoyl transferase component Bud32